MRFRKSSWLWSVIANRRPRRRKPVFKSLGLELLENRITPNGDLPYIVSNPALVALTLQVVASQLQIVNSQDPTAVLATQPLTTTSSVHIASTFNVTLTIDATVPRLPNGIYFDATGNTASTLVGPAQSPDIVGLSLTAARNASGDTLTRTDGKTWATSGLVPGQTITLTGSTTSPSNNGTYTIENIQGNVLVLNVANTLTAGTETNITVGSTDSVNHWEVTGANSGDLDGTDDVNFTNVQNLTASSSSDDRFDIQPLGSLTGVVTGNVARNDSIYVDVAAGQTAQSVGFSETSQPDGSLLDAWTINDAPLVNSTNINLPDNLNINDGTTVDNQSVLAASSFAGMLQLTSTNGNFQPVRRPSRT